MPKPPPIKWNLYTNPEILDEALAQPHQVMIHTRPNGEQVVSSMPPAAAATEQSPKKQRKSKAASSEQPAAASKPLPPTQSSRGPANSSRSNVSGQAAGHGQQQGSGSVPRGQGKKKKSDDPWAMMPPIPDFRTERAFCYHRT